jgi:hypothetical protein
LVVLAAVGCGGGSGSGTGGTGGSQGTGGTTGAAWLPTATTDDAATIKAGSAGSCSSSLLRKKVPITLSGGGTEFALGDGYLFADADLPSYANLAVPVTNLGSTMHCFVAITTGSYQWNTAQGSAKVALSGPYATGSVGDVGSGIWTETCLAAGETGLILDIESSLDMSDLFTPTVSIAMALESSTDGTPPPAALVPQTYTDAGSTLTVAFQNVGTGAGDIDRMGPYVLVDSGGLPAAWGFLDEMPTGLLDAGQQGTATATTLGCGQTARAYIVFDSPPAAPAPAGLDLALAAARQSELAWRNSLGARLSAMRTARGW